jgi:hypothetical protein
LIEKCSFKQRISADDSWSFFLKKENERGPKDTKRRKWGAYMMKTLYIYCLEEMTGIGTGMNEFAP